MGQIIASAFLLALILLVIWMVRNVQEAKKNGTYLAPDPVTETEEIPKEFHEKEEPPYDEIGDIVSF